MEINDSVSPDPPIVGKVTHKSIELIWDKEHALKKTSSFTSSIHRNTTKKYVVQEQEVSGSMDKSYGTVYSGFAQRNTFEGLKPRSVYRYRIKYKVEDRETLWSRPVEVMTLKQPSSSEDLQKAVIKNDVELVLRLLKELNRELINAPDKIGYSPLMNAVSKGNVKVARVLIENGADMSYENSSGKSAMTSACFAGSLESVKMLHSFGCEWSCKDKSGTSPLHYAVDSGNVDLVRWMVNNGCKVDPRDATSGWTPLMRLASTSGAVNIARVLMQHGADFDATDFDKKSVLMMATLNSHEELVALLIAKGVKVDRTNSYGKTAVDFSRPLKNKKILKMLEEAFAKQKRANMKNINRSSNFTESDILTVKS